MKADYPNLELLEYIAQSVMRSDEVFQKTMEEKRKKDKFLCPEWEAVVFPQIWGSTNTGFDVTEDGDPVMGGCAMTKAYTTVMHELVTETYLVFFDGRPCYKVDHPTEAFYEDLKTGNLASLSEAKEKY